MTFPTVPHSRRVRSGLVGRRWLISGILGAWFWMLSPASLPAQQKFVELVEEGTAYQGKVVARTDSQVWLVQENGWMRTLDLKKIDSFRKLSDDFRPASAADVRDALRRELGGGMDVVGTGHYLVAGPSGLVGEYAQLFEDQYRAVYNHFAVRNFDIHPPEYPLVAIVFPDFQTFAKYSAKDKIEARGGLKGYYLQSSNRIAVYHETPRDGAVAPARRHFVSGMPGIDLAPGSSHAVSCPEWLLAPPDEHLGWGDGRLWGTTDGDLQATIIHEATHQVAFNIGIHSRIGQPNPRWVVEGLATVFEAPGMRSSSLAMTPGAKLNRMRLTHFREFVKSRRQPKTLEAYVQSDQGFGANVLDGYSQAWALTYFLMETRSSEYGRYLKLIAARSPVEVYEDKQRLADFKQAFGNDLVLLEAKFLRYLDEVTLPPSHVSGRPKKIRTLDDLRRNGINPIDKSQLVPLPMPMSN